MAQPAAKAIFKQQRRAVRVLSLKLSVCFYKKLILSFSSWLLVELKKNLHPSQVNTLEHSSVQLHFCLSSCSWCKNQVRNAQNIMEGIPPSIIYHCLSFFVGLTLGGRQGCHPAQVTSESQRLIHRDNSHLHYGHFKVTS